MRIKKIVVKLSSDNNVRSFRGDVRLPLKFSDVDSCADGDFCLVSDVVPVQEICQLLVRMEEKQFALVIGQRYGSCKYNLRILLYLV